MKRRVGCFELTTGGMHQECCLRLTWSFHCCARHAIERSIQQACHEAGGITPVAAHFCLFDFKLAVVQLKVPRASAYPCAGPAQLRFLDVTVNDCTAAKRVHRV